MYTGKRGLALPRFYKNLGRASPHLPAHQENEEAVWAHFTSLRAFKCVHPASGVKWSRNIVVKLFGAVCWCHSRSWGAGCSSFAVQNFLLFIMCIFLWKNLELILNAFFINIERKNLNKKRFSVFEGAPLKHSKHTMTFFLQNVFDFFQHSWTMHLIPIQKNFKAFLDPSYPHCFVLYIYIYIHIYMDIATNRWNWPIGPIWWRRKKLEI